ncbi:MAG TPA: tetratricopeptide repeat protein [Steroidobacteraceae bacterium]
MRIIVAALLTGVAFLARTVVRANPLPVKSHVTSADSKQADELRDLLAGRQFTEQGHPQEAITKYFDPVINRYERSRKRNTRYFSANSPGQGLIYAALPAATGDDSVNVIVTDANWANAYLLKGYALTELHLLADAQTAIGKAIELSPFNSQYKAELAFTYQAQEDCARSIQLYSEAADNAEMSDDSTKTADLTRAWRGQGYRLVEQGKWDEAAAVYEKCLALDPKDDKARGELRYVEARRPRSDPHATP